MARKARTPEPPVEVPVPEPRFALFPEACEYAAIPASTMRDWIRKGYLPAYRIGPRLLQIDLNDIDALRRRVRAADPSAKSA